ncbi:unnamed protein product [Phytophthora fragariaefolia]|uniref:Unnamed protein product n=1 Tax=Phytophthora fragariaefolia TaxID=1490495 RepID=A0A9W6YA64_9STRA|nr:unnamed protein product [Phytophthora fragariaefolia]
MNQTAASHGTYTELNDPRPTSSIVLVEPLKIPASSFRAASDNQRPTKFRGGKRPCCPKLSKILAFLFYQASEEMEISALLCSSPARQSKNVSPSPEPAAPTQEHESVGPHTGVLKLLSDKNRKRPYRMSSAQRMKRRDHEAYESRVFNLTLDVNELRQQIQHLIQLQDIYLSRLLLSGQRFEGDVLKLVWTLMDDLRGGTFGLAPSARSTFLSSPHVIEQGPEASGNVHQFVMKRARPTFSRPTFTIRSIQLVARADSQTIGNNASEIRRVCGSAGGCVVEVLANFTGRIRRETLEALLPQILSNETLVTRIIGQQITFLSRLLLYFNARRSLVQQVAQADIVSALKALRLGEEIDIEDLLAD